MFDDDEEQSPAERKAENLAPKTRDLAAEITPSGANEDDDLESGMLEQRDRVAEISADSETATAFWGAVIYLNVGLLLITLGPMLLFFRGRTQIGPLLMVLGGFALYRAYAVYQEYTAPDEGGEADEGEAQAETAAESGVEDAVDEEPAGSEEVSEQD